MYPHDVEPWEKNITTPCRFPRKMGEHDRQEDQRFLPALKKEKEAVSKWVSSKVPDTAKGRLPRCAGLPYAHQRNAGILPVCKKALQDIIDFYTK